MSRDDLDRRLAALPEERRRLLELRLARERARRGAGALEPAPREPPAAAPDLAGMAAARAAAAPDPPGSRAAAASAPGRRPLDFSLFFFSAHGAGGAPGSDPGPGGKYRLLLEAARFADREGFAAVWTPERHFVDFGGLYPNPSVLAAALAMVTERVQLRAGSVVLPLHHPVRVAEEWAVVDNLSGGRAAISCASGWHPSDFALRPGTWEERREVLFRDLETIRRLWRGEPLTVTGGDGAPYEVRLRPRPLQADLPVWITSAGSPATWERAGTAGANLLATLGSQPLPDLARKIGRYREARALAGHDPAAGIVSVMLHAFVGDDLAAVKARVREPLGDYLRTYLAQRDNFLAIPGITEADKEALVPIAFEHYVREASLLGTPESCRGLLDRLAAAGVDEIACLIDFGLPAGEVLAGLPALAALARERRAGAAPDAAEETAAAPAGALR